MSWIKIETATPNKNEVALIAAGLKNSRRNIFDEALGALVRLWIWADQNTQTGETCTKKEALDAILRRKGFASLLIQAGWLTEDHEGNLSFPNFLRHNSQSAKTRALQQLNSAAYRARKKANPSSPRHYSVIANNDQRREEKSIYMEGLNESPLASDEKTQAFIDDINEIAK